MESKSKLNIDKDTDLVSEENTLTDIEINKSSDFSLEEVESMLKDMEGKMMKVFMINGRSKKTNTGILYKLDHISQSISEMSVQLNSDNDSEGDAPKNTESIKKKISGAGKIIQKYLSDFEKIEEMLGKDDEFYLKGDELAEELKNLQLGDELLESYIRVSDKDNSTTPKELHTLLFETFFKHLSYEDSISPVTSTFVVEDNFDTHDKIVRPIMMKPRKINVRAREKKKYSIFNDSNLTEDYELGLRFYKLGFKTSFINYKTEKDFGNSRIATGEYFPNTFKASVKQKSRWIAGIVFQNWKIHGWDGSLKTKYFLARDRKTIFSFFGTTLSYLLLLYLIAYTVTHSLGLNVIPMVVEKNSFLWYMMYVCLFFMFVNIFHRFAFTYNWFGFRYALASIYRLFFDNIVNAFATIRAIKVFKQTKHKVVWDSTEHY